MHSNFRFFIVFAFIIKINVIQAQKINGISFVASRDKATQENVEPVINVGANYAAVMPFGFIRALDNPTVIFNTDRQWYGERREGAKDYINLLQSNNIKVMLKPQLWIWRGEYTGYLKMETEENWKTLEASYSKFILEYAQLAPLSEMKTPTVQSIIDGWRWWKGELSAFSKLHDKKILFTEWGYRSVDFTAKEPWASDHSVTTVNLEAQTNTIKATFEAVWNEDWFAGGFVWKWFIHHSESGGSNNNRVTPQNKPAEAVIKEYYDKN